MDVFLTHPGFWILPALLVVAFGFSNGYRDSSTVVATVVSTGALSPAFAFGLCALFEFFGALLVGSAITATMTGVVTGTGGAPVQAEVVMILSSALLAAFGWGIVSWWRAWPTSNSQALIAAIAGADWAVRSPHHFLEPGRTVVLIVLVASPVLGFMISTLATMFLRHVGEWMTPRARPPAQALHVLGCLSVSVAHGSNDGQMLAALLALSLAGAGGAENGFPPAALRLIAAGALAAGVLFGGRRILRKLGMKFYRIRDLQGLGAQMSAAATILTCGFFGFPASTTQVVSGSIVGAGVAKNPRSVRWLIVREIVASWIITLPVTWFLGALLAATFLEWGKP